MLILQRAVGKIIIKIFIAPNGGALPKKRESKRVLSDND
jgi:hypothetical protein